MGKKRIMVVEDEGIVALDIQSKLESKGYEVPAACSTGEDAVEKAGETRPDLVLMDIQLEGEMDGVAAAEQIRSRFNIPVVYLTAYSDDSTLQRAKVAEPFAYLLKPFEEKKLHTTIEIALYKHEIEQEKARLEAQLHQAQKMEAIGRLTSGIAYNFTNMLQGILGNLDLAMMQAPDDLRPFLDAADFDAQRAAQMLRQLMLFYQREQVENESVDLVPIVREVTAMCRDVFARKYGRKIDFDVQCQEDLPPVMGDSAQLRQCLTSLYTNAGEALDRLDDGRSPRIEVRALTTNFNIRARIPVSVPPQGEYLLIRVADNGKGIDADTRERLFEPFYTTKPDAQSPGLGLATTYAIVREHHGWIECESGPDKGTAFSVYLPLISPEEQVSATGKPETPVLISSEENLFDTQSLKGSEKVLVIADVDRFRKILYEMLERHGYEVLVGLDVRDGLNIFHHEKDDLDLVVLDLSMPDASSREVLNQLRAIDSSARVLVVTGYTTDSTPWQGARAVLNKPFKTHQLLRTVRQMLSE